MSGTQEVVFGQNPNQTRHAFRYTDALRLRRGTVMESVLQHLQPNLPLPEPAVNNAPFIGQVTVDGIELTYHAYRVSEELVNVGRITET